MSTDLENNILNIDCLIGMQMIEEGSVDCILTDLPYGTTKCSSDILTSNLHPTQKPVALYEELIKTFSNDGDLILDSCSGSGTIGIACLNTQRRFIGFETDKKYFDLSIERIEKHKTKIIGNG